MATVFWDAKGIRQIDYLGNGEAITGKYYANVLRKLRETIVEKTTRIGDKTCFLPA